MITALMQIVVILATGNGPSQGFHVAYKANRRNTGFAKLAPWMQRGQDALTLAVSAPAAWLESLLAFMRCRQQLIAASLAIALALAFPAFALANVAFIGVAGTTGTVNIDQLERDLLKKSGEAASLLEKTMKECQSFEEKDKDGKVVKQGRLMEPTEINAIQKLIAEGQAIKQTLTRAKGQENVQAEIDKLTHGMALGKKAEIERQLAKSLGQQFTESDAYKFAQEKAKVRATNWQADAVELQNTTLDSTSGSGGQLIVTDHRPGILPLLFKRLTIVDLLASGTTDSNSVTYMKESTFSNAAAAVKEGNPLPESTITFEQTSDPVQSVGHWIPVTDQMLEDVAQIRSYIDARLRLGQELAKEDQLLNGNGTDPNIRGLLNRTGLTTAEVRAGSVTNAEAIFTEIMKVFNASFVMPDGIVENPTNWQTTQLSKDGEGRYYGSGPFGSPQSATQWGLPVAVTPSIVAGTALVGSFKSSAQVFNKGGIRVEASNSHQDFFTRRLTALRAEERLALVVYRPAAFGKVTSLN